MKLRGEKNLWIRHSETSVGLRPPFVSECLNVYLALVGIHLKKEKSCLKNGSTSEIFTNVVSYAHNDDQEHEVEIIFSIEGETITVEILDDGRPFNPLEEAPELDIESSLEDRGIGGAGIRLAKQLMTELRYQRNSTRNHLTMIKKI